MILIKPSVSSCLAILCSDLVQYASHTGGEGSMKSSLNAFNEQTDPHFIQWKQYWKADTKKKQKSWRRKKLIIGVWCYPSDHKGRWSCKLKLELDLLTPSFLHLLFWFCGRTKGCTNFQQHCHLSKQPPTPHLPSSHTVRLWSFLLAWGCWDAPVCMNACSATRGRK